MSTTWVDSAAFPLPSDLYLSCPFVTSLPPTLAAFLTFLTLAANEAVVIYIVTVNVKATPACTITPTSALSIPPASKNSPASLPNIFTESLGPIDVGVLCETC